MGKPDIVEFAETETLEAAARAIADCAEGAITVWRPRTPAEAARPAERFVGMLNSLDVVAFLARSGAGADHERVMRTTPVADVVVRNPGLLREVDPGTRSDFFLFLFSPFFLAFLINLPLVCFVCALDLSSCDNLE